MEFLINEAIEQLPTLLNNLTTGTAAPPPLTIDQVTNVLGDTGGFNFLDNSVPVLDDGNPGPAEVRPQVEPGSGGEPLSESSKEVNTIITVDSTSCQTQEFSTTTSAHTAASTTEKLHTFEFIGRWINLDTLSFDIQPDSFLRQIYSLPIDLLSQVTCATNLSPFESFALVKPNIEMQFSVNGLRALNGKIIAFFVLDCYDRAPSDYFEGYMYPHVEIDLCSRNTGILTIGYNYFESLLEIHARRGKVTCNFGKVFLISYGMGYGNTSIPNIQLVVKYRFVKTQFAGISARKDITTVSTVPPHPGSVNVRSLLNPLPSHSSDIGYDTVQINTSNYSTLQTYPATRFDFSSGGDGKNLVHQMRLNPNRLTINANNMSSAKSTVSSIVREWGCIGTFDWSTGDSKNTTLFEQIVDPARLCFNDHGNGLIAVYSPLVMMANCFQFWRGPIEYKLKFVSNEFTTGELLVSASFGRDNVSEPFCQANSGYSKYIVIGKDREFTFTVPYIHVNPWKRMRVLPTYINSKTAYGNEGYYDGAARDVVWEQNQVFFRINVIASLRVPTGSASKIKCIILARAAEGFQLSVPCMQNCEIDYELPTLHPMPNYNWNEDKVPPEQLTSHDRVEINVSVTEPEDITMDFSQSKKFNILTNENHDSLLSIMQRPLLVLKHVNIENSKSTTKTSDAKAFYHPITPNPMVYKDQDYYNAMAQRSPQFTMLNTHQFWRGSMRFIFEFEEIDSNVVIIQLLPSSGIFKVGSFLHYNQNIYVDNTYPDNASFCGNGLAELRFDLNKQRIITVEVPFYRESNWCRTLFKSKISTGNNVTKGDPLYTNDVASYVSGHLLVWSEGDNESIAKYRLYIQPGDDFKMAGYISGMPINLPIVRETDYIVVTDDQPTNVPANTETDPKPSIKKRVTMKCHDRVEVLSELEMVEQIKNYMERINCKNMNKLPKIPVPACLLESKKHIIDKKIDVFNYTKPVGIINSIKNFVSDHPIASAMGALTIASPILGAGAVTASIAGTSSDLVHDTRDTLRVVRNSVETSTEAVNTNISILSRSLGTTVEVVRDKIEAISNATRSTIDKTSELFTKLYDQLSGIITPMTDKISSFFNVEVDISDFFFDFINLIINCNYKTFALVICKFLVKFKILSLKSVSSISQFIQNYVKRIFKTTEDITVDFDRTEADFTLQPETVSNEDKDFYSTLCGMFIGIVSAGFSVILTPTKYETMGFIKGITATACTSGFWSIVRSASIVMRNLIDCMVKCYKWISRKLFKDADYAIAFEEKAHFIETFCTEAQEYCREINKRSVTTIPGKKKKFLEILLRAMYIKTLIVKSEDKQLIKNVPALLQLCNHVIKTFDDYTPVMRTGIVGYNAFVICMVGVPGLGKSFITDEMVVSCLKKAKVPICQPDIFFYENPLNKYSSGFSDQPCIIEDDWCSSKSEEPLTKSLSMMINLASPAPYRPVQADLDEKKNLANPLIYYLNCNNAFPYIDPLVTTPDAIWRRRNILVTCSLREGASIPVLGEDDNVDRTYPHLQFQFHKDGFARVPEERAYSFIEAKEIISDRFADYHRQEKIKIKHRFSILMECIPHGNEQIFLDPFSVLHEYNAVERAAAGDTLPLDQVCENVKDIIMQMNEAEVNDTDRVEAATMSISSIAKSLVTKIVKKTYTGVFGVNKTYFSCNVCYSKNRFVYVKCSNATDTNIHGLCYECFHTLAERHRRDPDREDRLPKCTECTTGTYVHSVDTNVEHYICKLLGEAMEWCEIDGAEKVRRIHILHSSHDWLWNILGAIFWLSSIPSAECTSVLAAPFGILGIFGYFQEIYLTCRNYVYTMIDRVETDVDLYPEVQCPVPVTGELIHVPLVESTICKHRAMNKLTAENFKIMVEKYGELVVTSEFE